MAVYAVCVVVTVGIGVHFLHVGVPLVLPFSGLEMLALGAAWYWVLCKGTRQEVVRIEPERVVVQVGRGSKYCETVLQRQWVRAVLERPRNMAHGATRLKLRAHGCEIEIAPFLTDAERLGLGRELARHMPFVCLGGTDEPRAAADANPLPRDP